MYIQSTDVDRAIMSAEVLSAGLFEPTEEEKWNDEILWQPIPVKFTLQNAFLSFYFILFYFISSLF